MKIFISIIITVSCYFTTVAQQTDSSIKYIWKNDSTNITAAVEIHGLQKSNKSSFCIFYLNSVDTAFKTYSDSLFNTFANILNLNCPLIKISFYNVVEPATGVEVALFTQEFSTYILADIKKKYPQIKTNNPIVSGLNSFAVVALVVAINNPFYTNKTAMFFNENGAVDLSGIVSIAEAKKLKGKLYFYVNHRKTGVSFTDILANNLALNSSAVLYKFDDYDSLDSLKVFEEAYYWLMAEGNNYIISSED